MRYRNRHRTAFRILHDPSGFTLVEVLASLAITTISLVLVLQIFQNAQRASISSCNYSTAVIHAREKMEELYVEPVSDSGSFEDDFEWQTEVEPYEILEEEPDDTDYIVLKLKVNIIWKELSKKKSFELVTLKTVEAEDE